MLSDFIDLPGQRRIAQAITDAERRTSGEICVHVTPHCEGDVMRRARDVFDRLQLYRTRGRNAVLIFIAYEDRRVAILGDRGVDERVPDGFWDEALQLLVGHLAAGRAVEGVCDVVRMVGDRLCDMFPADRTNINELSNEVTYED